MWKTIDIHSVWGKDSCPCQLSFLSQVLARLKMRPVRVLGAEISTRLFHLWKTIDIHSVWVVDSCPYQLSFLSQVLARLEMRHTRVLGAGTPSNAYLTF